jgi:aspartate racemase
MKKIGIVGGADPAASCLLYKKIIATCQEQYHCVNGSEFPEIVIINYPFTHGLLVDDARRHEQILVYQLQYCIDKLVECDVDIIAIACNTLHLFLKKVSLRGKEMVHIVQSILDEVGVMRPFVFGSQATVFHKLFGGEEIVSPSSADQEVIDKIIEHIHAGHLIADDSKKLIAIVQARYLQQSFDSIILGCTDLSVLHERHPISLVVDERILFIADSINILARRLVECSFGHKSV